MTPLQSVSQDVGCHLESSGAISTASLLRQVAVAAPVAPVATAIPWVSDLLGANPVDEDLIAWSQGLSLESVGLPEGPLLQFLGGLAPEETAAYP